MADLAFGDQLLDRARDLFHRHVGIDAVLVEQIDVIGLEPPQAAVDGGLDVVRPARRRGARR